MTNLQKMAATLSNARFEGEWLSSINFIEGSFYKIGEELTITDIITNGNILEETVIFCGDDKFTIIYESPADIDDGGMYTLKGYITNDDGTIPIFTNALLDEYDSITESDQTLGFGLIDQKELIIWHSISNIDELKLFIETRIDDIKNAYTNFWYKQDYHLSDSEYNMFIEYMTGDTSKIEYFLETVYYSIDHGHAPRHDSKLKRRVTTDDIIKFIELNK